MRRDVPKVLQCEVFRVPTGGRQRGGPDSNQIVAAFVPFTRRGQPVRPTLLFSHGNAVDLGQMMPFYKCAAACSGPITTLSVLRACSYPTCLSLRPHLQLRGSMFGSLHPTSLFSMLSSHLLVTEASSTSAWQPVLVSSYCYSTEQARVGPACQGGPHAPLARRCHGSSLLFDYLLPVYG